MLCNNCRKKNLYDMILNDPYRHRGIRSPETTLDELWAVFKTEFEDDVYQIPYNSNASSELLKYIACQIVVRMHDYIPWDPLDALLNHPNSPNDVKTMVNRANQLYRQGVRSAERMRYFLMPLLTDIDRNYKEGAKLIRERPLSSTETDALCRILSQRGIDCRTCLDDNKGPTRVEKKQRRRVRR